MTRIALDACTMPAPIYILVDFTSAKCSSVCDVTLATMFIRKVLYKGCI